MGLRNDELQVGDPFTLAVPRPSWYAYQRLADLLVGYGGARLIAPVVLGGVFSPGVEDALLVFEARVRRLTDGVRYLYVVMVDPTASEGVEWCVEAEWTRAEGEIFQEIELEPETTSGDPEPIGTYASPHARAVPLQLCVVVSATPLAYESDQPLTWRVALCEEGTSLPRVPPIVRIGPDIWTEEDTVLINGIVAE